MENEAIINTQKEEVAQNEGQEGYFDEMWKNKVRLEAVMSVRLRCRKNQILNYIQG